MIVRVRIWLAHQPPPSPGESQVKIILSKSMLGKGKVRVREKSDDGQLVWWSGKGHNFKSGQVRA